MCLSGNYSAFSRLFYFFSNLDLRVQDYVQTINSPCLLKIMIIITYLGSPWVFVILSALTSSYLWFRGKKLETIFLNVTLFSAWGIMEGLKHLFKCGRPAGQALTMARGYSFPSGHAMLSLAFYGFLAALLLKYGGRGNKQAWLGAVALYILVLLIGLSRIYLNVHYLSDVMAGCLFGILILILSLKAMKLVQNRL
ncbi:MAG TPA: PAP2 family protein [Syntrophomonas wolfei]|jgi:undecaprenyl-diphosphatase|uniref:PAP2 family protein n=1 Tax=Syntrophomonas wolfei TaxID=863 RepID=A0A354YWP4_9FIRM|nr:PAP2 family protein [Syntrophomonas wolfei]